MQSPAAGLDTCAEPGALRQALIVAHGQPSDPDPAEAALAVLAARVADALPPGWQVESATLAAPGALEAALSRFGDAGPPLLIYPMFIADGWFTQVNLPKRLRAAGLNVMGVEETLEAKAGAAKAGEARADAASQRASTQPEAAGEGLGPEAHRAAPVGGSGRRLVSHAVRGGMGDDSRAADDLPGNPAGPGSAETGAPSHRAQEALGPDAAARGRAAVEGEVSAPAEAAGEPALGPPNSPATDAARRDGQARTWPADRPTSPRPRAATILPPFGLDPGILPLALRILGEALAEQGWRAAETRLIVAAHGSFKSPAPAAVARRLARAIISDLPFAEMRTAFIDQAPRIAEAAREMPPPALCLPLFAAAGGHVEEDLPAALAEAGFAGRSLPPLGLASGVPGLVAAALQTAASRIGGRGSAAAGREG